LISSGTISNGKKVNRKTAHRSAKRRIRMRGRNRRKRKKKRTKKKDSATKKGTSPIRQKRTENPIKTKGFWKTSVTQGEAPYRKWGGNSQRGKGYESIFQRAQKKRRGGKDTLQFRTTTVRAALNETQVKVGGGGFPGERDWPDRKGPKLSPGTFSMRDLALRTGFSRDKGNVSSKRAWAVGPETG